MMMTLESIEKKINALQERKKKLQDQIAAIDEQLKKLTEERRVAAMQKISSSLKGKDFDSADVDAFIEFLDKRREKAEAKKTKNPDTDKKEENQNEASGEVTDNQTEPEAEGNTENQSEGDYEADAVNEEKNDSKVSEPVKPQPNISIIGQNNRYVTPPRKNP